MNFYKLTIKRLKSETPAYFANIRLFCAWYASAASACLVACNALSLYIPSQWVTIIGYSIVGATFLGFGASLTTTDEKLKGMQ